ncbi:MAG: hypothetical protein GX112_03865 [Clostridiaceae bacterium]|jgi:D-3-phosphoglycerate dehydrogenase|nr:hypothetical protein [Clostridiaceae bacterium]
METLLLSAPVADAARERRLLELGVATVRCGQLRLDSDEAFIGQVHGHAYVVSGPGRWSEAVFSALKGSLRLAVKFGVGVDNFDLAAATRAGIAVANAPGSNAEAVAEHTVALILALLRRIGQAASGIRQGHWQLQCDTLIGKTVGLLGYGQIARQVAAFLGGFPLALLAHDIRPGESGPAQRVVSVGLDELLARSDVISLHLPLTEKTRNMVDAAFLARMKRGAYLVNTARGGLVSEFDLVNALREGQLGGAGLDTFATEPLPLSSPLLGLDNVILTPHCASNTEQAYRSILACCLDNIIAFKTGCGDAHVLNPDYAKHLVSE